MNLDEVTEQERIKLAEWLFQPLNSAADIKIWAKLFLDLDIPLEITDPDSNSSPLDAIWQIYNTLKNNSGDKNPGYILMSCREGMKTVSVAILETLLLLHFQLDIGHAAATEDQSSIALGYISSFLIKLDPLIKLAGWTYLSQHKRLFKFRTPQQKTPFIKIVICTPRGMNSLHSNVLFLDELDLADPEALVEGNYITGFSKGIHGITVFLSTRKYAFGNMAAAIEKVPETNYKVVRWNIMDVTERCPATRHLPDGPKQNMYVHKNLPLQKKFKEEFELLPDVERPKWELLENVHDGCTRCPLLPVCKGRLASKAETATGGFYKPISSVIQSFAKNDPDSAEAQLMCWKPGSAGLVYPRFSGDPLTGNLLSVRDAYVSIFGPTNNAIINDLTLLYEMKKLGILFYAGLDWGYLHDFVIVIIAMIPNGEVWLIETYASPGLEFSDQLEVAKTFRDKYGIHKWYVDQAMPSSIKTFNRSGMKCVEFKKDVMGGIEALRSKILGSSSIRKFKVLANETNKKAITAIQKHRFMLDGQGNPTLNPDDDPGISDICDSLRYVAQNLFPIKGYQKPEHVTIDPRSGLPPDPNDPEARQRAEIASKHEEQMKAEIMKRIGLQEEAVVGTAKKGGFFFIS